MLTPPRNSTMTSYRSFFLCISCLESFPVNPYEKHMTEHVCLLIPGMIWFTEFSFLSFSRERNADRCRPPWGRGGGSPRFSESFACSIKAAPLSPSEWGTISMWTFNREGMWKWHNVLVYILFLFMGSLDDKFRTFIYTCTHVYSEAFIIMHVNLSQ